MKERADVLGFMGEEPGARDRFRSLFKTACDLRGKLDSNGKIPNTDNISVPEGCRTLPAVHKLKLYVRQIYKKLFDQLEQDFTDTPTEVTQNRMVLIGTSGIGKSVFLIYFTIRLLAECDNNNPPVVIFHPKIGTSHTECYVFGGTLTFRTGSIADFSEFFTLPETWYLADGISNPQLFETKTIIVVSPNTLYAGSNEYQEVDKESPRKYYMAPWSLSEMNECRQKIFPSVMFNTMNNLFSKLGGIPRYVLQSAVTALNQNEDIEMVALERLHEALNSIEDPAQLLQCVGQNRTYLKLSNNLLHRWPIPDAHRQYRLGWASKYVLDQIHELLVERTWTDSLADLV